LRTWQENAKSPEVFDARIDEIKSMPEAVTALQKVSNLAYHYFSQHVQTCDHLSGDFDSLQKLLPTHGRKVQWGLAFTQNQGSTLWASYCDWPKFVRYVAAFCPHLLSFRYYNLEKCDSIL
jgi:hypothetical protein